MLSSMKLFFFSLLLLGLSVTTALAQESGDESATAVRSRTVTSTRLTSTPPEVDPLFALRSGRVIFVKSSSLLVGVSVIEEKLQKRREFRQLGLAITRDPEAADIVLEVHHDVFTKYVYSAVDPRTSFLLASGKLSSLGGTVAGKVAEKFLKQVVQARLGQPGP